MGLVCLMPITEQGSRGRNYKRQISFLFWIGVSMCTLSHVQFFATPWTVAHQASLSMGFSKQEYWRGLPFPSPGDLPDPGMKPVSPALQADSLY